MSGYKSFHDHKHGIFINGSMSDINAFIQRKKRKHYENIISGKLGLSCHFVGENWSKISEKCATFFQQSFSGKIGLFDI